MVVAFEPGISWGLPSLYPPKERLKRFVQVGHHDLQDMALNLCRIRVFLAVVFYLRKLLELAHAALLIRPGGLSFRETDVVPSATGFDRLNQQTALRL